MSQVNVNTISDALGTMQVPTSTVVHGSAKAWANYDCATPGTRQNFNIASITRTGSGIYRVVFTNPMQDSYYSVVATTSPVGTSSTSEVALFTEGTRNTIVPTANGFSLTTYTADGASSTQPDYLCFAVFR